MEGTAAIMTTAKSFAFIAPIRLGLKRSRALGLDRDPSQTPSYGD
jgi:hypothetical protein